MWFKKFNQKVNTIDVYFNVIKDNISRFECHNILLMFS